MEIRAIAVASIHVADRCRPISPAIVGDLQQSIAQQGLLQPIGIKPNGEGYRLIFGAHRLAAFEESGIAEIPARVFPAEMSDDACLLAEIQENTARNDLTAAERKALAAEVGRICLKLGDLSNAGDLSNLDKSWLMDMAEKSGQARSTVNNWWSAFTKATGRDITPKQATENDRQAFFDWLADHKRKEEEDKARKAAEAQAEKERKEQEARAKRLADEREELLRYLDDTAKLCGRKVVKDWLYQWIEAAA